MKLKNFFLLFFLLVVSMVQAQKMRDVFAEMPDDVLRVMTKNNRLDCIDFIENNMTAKVRNRLEGFSELKRLTSDYLDLSLTERTRVEMKLLPIADSLNIIAVVKTYSGPMKMSTLTLYDAEWKRLPQKDYITFPQYEAYWVLNDTLSHDDVKRLQSLQDMHFITMTLEETSCRLVFELHPGDVEKEDAEQMKKVLQPIVFVWDGKKFRRLE